MYFVTCFLALWFLISTIFCFPDEYVNGHFENGRYVQGYYRSDKNNTVRDNFSYKGNINPYTYEEGHNYYRNNPTSEYYNNTPDHPAIKLNPFEMAMRTYTETLRESRNRDDRALGDTFAAYNQASDISRIQSYKENIRNIYKSAINQIDDIINDPDLTFEEKESRTHKINQRLFENLINADAKIDLSSRMVESSKQYTSDRLYDCAVMSINRKDAYEEPVIEKVISEEEKYRESDKWLFEQMKKKDWIEIRDASITLYHRACAYNTISKDITDYAISLIKDFLINKDPKRVQIDAISWLCMALCHFETDDIVSFLFSVLHNDAYPRKIRKKIRKEMRSVSLS